VSFVTTEDEMPTPAPETCKIIDFPARGESSHHLRSVPGVLENVRSQRQEGCGTRVTLPSTPGDGA
jgi:hypothetical protein